MKQHVVLFQNVDGRAASGKDSTVHHVLVVRSELIALNLKDMFAFLLQMSAEELSALEPVPEVIHACLALQNQHRPRHVQKT